MDSDYQERCEQFAALHTSGTLVLANAWDAASAAVIAQAGAPAIATTSSGVSWSLGVADGEHLQRDDAIEAIRRIVAAVDVPVSADLEGGYGPQPDDVATTIALATDAGAVGANLEDSPGTDGQPLRTVAVQCERLAAARVAADKVSAAFTVNARTDVYLRAVGPAEGRLAEVLERAGRYRDAGADCLFVPGIADPGEISTLVASAPLPVNVMLLPGFGPSVAELRELGVRRVSLGSFVAQAAYGTAAGIVRQIEDGAELDPAAAMTFPAMQELLR